VIRELLDQRETLAHRVHQDLMERLGRQDPLELPAHQGSLDRLVLQDFKVLLA